MAALREWLVRFWGTLRPGRRDAELERELHAHLELAAEHERRDVDSNEAARRAAAIGVGSVPHAMDALRDQRGLPWLDELTRDARHAIRGLRRNPMFASITLLTLALSLGANTAVFSVVNSVLLKPLAYPHADDLVAVWHTAPGAEGLSSVSGDLRLSPSMYFTYAEQNRTLQEFGIWQEVSTTVTGLAEPEQVRTVVLTAGVLQALEVQPAVGRWLTEVDQAPGGPQTVMLGYGYWQRRFGGDASVLGRVLLVNSRSLEVVGVMPRGFRLADVEPEVIVPVAFDRSRLILPGFGFQALARLKPGVTIAEASADVARMTPIWMTSWPAAPGINPRIYESWRIGPALRPLKDDVVGKAGDVLWLVMATIGIVLAIACANVANLLLVRAEARQQELAIRASLGAGRTRIARALLIESAVLGLLGGAIGLGFARAALALLVAIAPANLPRLDDIAIDGRALGFTLIVSLLSGLLLGLIPVSRYVRPGIADGLRDNARTSSQSKRRHHARSALVVAQVALALVLLVSSMLMVRTFQGLRTIEPGFVDAQHIQTVRISIPPTLVPEPDRVAGIQHDITEKIAAIPGVSSVGFSSVMHMEGLQTPWDAIRIEGAKLLDDEIPPMRVFKFVSPRFFTTTGTRLVAGRDYTWTDLAQHRRFVIVSENLARELWGTPNEALGRRIQGVLPDSPWREVIGVVQDVRDNGVQEPSPAIVYWPALGENPNRTGPIQATRTVSFAIRSERAGSDDFLQAVGHAVWSVNASLPLASPRTLQTIYDGSMARTAFALVMLAIAAAVALVLGLVGIYGVIAYVVSQRTREIGIRLALGAQPGELKRMFVRYGLVLAAIGVVFGLCAAAGVTRLMSSLLFGIDPLDPLTYAVVPLVLVLAAALASYLPARRVSGVDPMEALRAE